MQVAVRIIRSQDLFKILLLEKSGDFCTIYVVLFVMKLTSFGIRVGGGDHMEKLPIHRRTFSTFFSN